MQNHEFYMQRCLDLAKKGIGNVSTNPMVGSVIVFNNQIIGEGYHKKYGESHAELNAISSVKNKKLLCKSTLYVNLEPCAHIGKTPACSDLIIKSKIPKVVIGCLDTHKKVCGNGIKKMNDSGIEIILGVLEKESREINKRFFTFNEEKRPYVILKWAKSKDGYIAPKKQNGPFWMTNLKSKKIVHKWRSEEDAILIGRVTAEKDNPFLTVRETYGKNPTRVVIDRKLKLSEKLNLFNNDAETIIFNEQISKRNDKHIYTRIKFDTPIINIIHKLYLLNIQSIIVEGGEKTIQSFIDSNLWDEARIFTTKISLTNGIKSPIINLIPSKKRTLDNDFLEIFYND